MDNTALQSHYNDLFDDSVKSIRKGEYQIDKQIDSCEDQRYEITLIIRPSSVIKKNIIDFTRDLSLIEPDQYYYPQSDIHITVMSIISCYDGFQLAQINSNEYVKAVISCLNKVKPFKLNFEGVTASPSCVMIQGFSCDNSLHQLREALRFKFKSLPLEQSIDKRYAIQTAHSTVCRLKNSLSQTEEYLKVLNNYRTHKFGSFEVDSLDLVANDWYQRNEKTILLHRFKLA